MDPAPVLEGESDTQGLREERDKLAVELEKERLDARLADERIRILEREKLASLRDAVEGRALLEGDLKEALTALQGEVERREELEQEVVELRGLLEGFMGKNWETLTESAAEAPAPVARFRKLPNSGGSAKARPVLVPDFDAQPEVQAEESDEVVVEKPPSQLSRDELTEALRGGAEYTVTAAFKRFEPVSRVHVMASDWIYRSSDLESLLKLADGALAEEALLKMLYLFYQRSYLTLSTP